MRDFLNAILSFIGAESLTDEEFDSVTIEDTNEPFEVYTQLSQILQSRESVSGMQDRLWYYYKAKGFDFSQSETGTSNIYVGGGLC